MKKYIYSLLFVLLVGCQQQATDVLPIAQTHNSDKNVENVDVTNRHGSIEGLARMADFYQAVKAGKHSDLRIAQYTVEGAPIVTDLRYDGQVLEVVYDTTRDRFGHPAITTVMCGDLVEDFNSRETTYLAVDCAHPDASMLDILSINYDVSRLDSFDFVLSYGGEIIDTRTDVQLTAAMKQEVYKQLVLANDLADKPFTASCTAEDAIHYELQIFIGDSTRDYLFSSCDESADGVRFAALAMYIVEQATNPQPTAHQVIGYVLAIDDDELLIGEDLNVLSYKWMQEELPHIDFAQHSARFVVLEGVKTTDFQEGDKIFATVKNAVTTLKPQRAYVQEIMTINVHE